MPTSQAVSNSSMTSVPNFSKLPPQSVHASLGVIRISTRSRSLANDSRARMVRGGVAILFNGRRVFISLLDLRNLMFFIEAADEVQIVRVIQGCSGFRKDHIETSA